jgi:poly-gamma-glutamate synthesis protein (capsule biosynthesis protein)
MLLTANNHSYDTGYTGFIRTQQIIADRGLEHIGTRLNVADKNYAVQEISGIRIGMICYTYNNGTDKNGNVSLNLHELSEEASALVNSFCPWELPSFYEKLTRDIANMRADGAEAMMLYIHWGEEYQTTPTVAQKEMAQELCDLGIDVIVGNHAHVIQPVELLTNSKDESKKTLCLYSMGNAVSNIRGSSKYPSHCEDGLLFQVTFAKYSDGTVILESAEILPTWVNRYNENGISKFRILAMDGDSPEKWRQDMGLTDELLEKCRASYDRTQEIVAGGLVEANAHFAKMQAETEEKFHIK